ncbi:lactonase family protein [Occallatibacter riparius]|uniref:Lactonase family protein n=1 Tax=Occallatibacter riparius TaxID=1002689 RepID=A0A9J7BXI4_9BACT|nr:lactonase family protein [Occallatibacter riparius]UWZ86634.1 lactonase family protein [Occallatibacter riparius]
MKFRKFGKALLMSALSVGAVLSLSSCVQSYTVGFLYVTGNQTSGSTGQGVISGFKIDHNTGQLRPVNGMPVASGGSNPVRAILLQGSRFVYVLNKGRDANGGADCTSAGSPCAGANVTLFSVGGNGSLSPQPQTFTSQGNNPLRMIADASGTYVFVLDHDAPDSGKGTSNSCSLALGPNVTTCGDITVFKVDSTTGRLSLVLNSQVSSAAGQPLPYFPVPVNPVDFVISGSYVLTLTDNPSVGNLVFPYNYSQATGQLTISQNGPQPLNINKATAIQSGNGSIYVLDNEPITYSGGIFGSGSAPSQILPYTVGSGGALQAQSGGAVPVDATQSNPLFLLVESKGKWAYVANTGNSADPNNAQSGLTGYVIDNSTKQLTPMSGSPFGAGAGPQCLVEDPSNQFVYTAGFNDSAVSGRVLDQNSGVLNLLPGKANKAYALPGPATYCLVNGRTS